MFTIILLFSIWLMFIIDLNKKIEKYNKIYRNTKVKYFAYGANLNSNVMNRRGINYYKKSKGIVYGKKVIFNIKGLFGETFANIKRAKKFDNIQGLIYDINFYNLLKLHQFEKKYFIEKLRVYNTSKKIFEYCYSFTVPYNSTQLKKRKPTERYLLTIIKGAEKEGLSKKYIELLKKVQTNKNIRYINPNSIIIKIFDFLQNLIWFLKID